MDNFYDTGDKNKMNKIQRDKKLILYCFTTFVELLDENIDDVLDELKNIS